MDHAYQPSQGSWRIFTIRELLASGCPNGRASLILQQLPLGCRSRHGPTSGRRNIGIHNLKQQRESRLQAGRYPRTNCRDYKQWGRHLFGWRPDSHLQDGWVRRDRGLIYGNRQPWNWINADIQHLFPDSRNRDGKPGLHFIQG